MEANVWPWGVGLGLLSKVLVLTEDGSSLGAGGLQSLEVGAFAVLASPWEWGTGQEP